MSDKEPASFRLRRTRVALSSRQRAKSNEELTLV